MNPFNGDTPRPLGSPHLWKHTTGVLFPSGGRCLTKRLEVSYGTTNKPLGRVYKKQQPTHHNVGGRGGFFFFPGDPTVAPPGDTFAPDSGFSQGEIYFGCPEKAYFPLALEKSPRGEGGIAQFWRTPLVREIFPKAGFSQGVFGCFSFEEGPVATLGGLIFGLDADGPVSHAVINAFHFGRKY